MKSDYSPVSAALRRYAKCEARLTVLATIVALVLLLVPFPAGGSRAAEVVENACHAPLFFALAWIGLRWQRARLSNRPLRFADHVWVWTGATLFGGLAELAQSLTGRDPSFLDLGNDAVGAGLSLFASAWRARAPFLARMSVHWLLVGLIVAGVLLTGLPLATTAAAYAARARQVPLLFTCNSWPGSYFVEFNRQATILPANPQCSANFLQVPLDSGTYPGLTLEEPYPDWRGYRTLILDVGNASNQPLPLNLSIRDQHRPAGYADRYNVEFELPAQSRREVSLPIADVVHGPRNRDLDLQHIAQLVIFREAPAPGAALQLFAVRLVR